MTKAQGSISTNPPTPVPAYRHHCPRETLLPHLAKYLPTCITLYRRIQYHFQTEYATVLSTLSPDEPLQDGKDAEPFAALYIDRSRLPETEAWIFSTAECELPMLSSEESSTCTPTSSILSVLSASSLHTSRQHLLSLLTATLAFVLTPGHQPPSFPEDRDPRYIRIGAVHEMTLSLFKNSGILFSERGFGAIAPHQNNAVVSLVDALAEGTPLQGVLKAQTLPYVVFVFGPDRTVSLEPERLKLPEGLRWDKARAEDLALVVARTNIPRSKKMLGMMPSAVIRVAGGTHRSQQESPYKHSPHKEWPPDTVLTPPLSQTPGRPVAWAFLGADGSLSSLHVEADYRGRGLAKLIARKVFALLADGGRDKEREVDTDESFQAYAGAMPQTAFAVSCVAKDNPASAAVARSLRGEEGWECFWTEVDMLAAKNTLGQMEGGGAAS